MISCRVIAMCLSFVALFPSTGGAQNLAKYRDFEFGMSIEAVAKQANMNPSDAITIHERPAMIQTLDWMHYGYPAASLDRGSLRNIRFDFYNGELSKLVVTYDSIKTEGLTTGDMIEAISALYGPATMPEGTVVISWPAVNEDIQKVLARWEDEQYSYNLFRFSYSASFGLTAFSKRLDLMSRATSLEATRLDKLEAPAREAESRRKQEEEWRAAQEKARLTSKPNFRP